MDLEARILRRLNPKGRPEVKIGPPKEEKKRLYYPKGPLVYEYITQRLNEHHAAFLEQLGICKFRSLSEPSTEQGWAMGMVTAVGRLTRDTAHLFSTIDSSNRALTKLDLGRLSRFTVFPGQVIAVCGTNPLGHEIKATRVLCASSLEIQLHKAEEIREKYPGPVVVHVLALNPGAGSGSLSEAVGEVAGDVLIVVGALHAEDVRVLERWMDASGGKVICIPPVGEMESGFLFPAEHLSPPESRVLFMPSPSVFSINEFRFGVSSFDALRDLASAELSFVSDAGDALAREGAPPDDHWMDVDRMKRLCMHLVCQKSFCPVFPSHLDTPIDLRCHASLSFPLSLDFLVVPSRLQAFYRFVDPSFVINPGYFGTAARIEIFPLAGARGETPTLAGARSAVSIVAVGAQRAHSVLGPKSK